MLRKIVANAIPLGLLGCEEVAPDLDSRIIIKGPESDTDRLRAIGVDLDDGRSTY